ncbi:MAG: adenosylcobalamin-dependent ribonucleoside-diphosphate reductase [Planctomycetes bacterium]|nr:adenosylcobalamin-dependent ribonucleoside-diphosphate reductase [Planctomycetota bacterium]
MERPDLSLPLTENARTVLQHRYLKRDEEGRIVETPEDLFWRVASAAAAAEADPEPAAEAFYRALASLEFIPNSPALMNAGRDLGQYFACFVLPVKDTLASEAGDGIFDSIRAAAIIHKSGGGTGFSFSHLRPAGTRVRSTHGTTSGPISFMRVFNAATEAIHQGGFRRGANMGILRVDHPDILDFINLKRNLREMTNFNLSVGITDAFLDAIRDGRPHAVFEPHTGRTASLRDSEGREWTSREVWDLIIQRAWESGEPGLAFLDRINSFNPTPQLGPMEATNPCGEMPLLPFEACNLGSINVSKFVAGEDIDWPRLARAIRLAVRFLDDVIDINRYPLPQIERLVKANRKIGLGLMGWADLLFLLGWRYDGEPALALARRLARFFKEEGWMASMELAKERGPFPNYAGSLFTTGPQDHPYFADVWKRSRRPLRNATVTTIAPTGTISIIAGCSGGIEPLYALSFSRQVLGGRTLPEVHAYFREVARREGFWSERLMARILAEGTCRNIPDVPTRWKDIFVCAYDVPPEGHLRMQAAFQEFTDNAVSKTVNFPEHATPEDVRKVFELAIQLGVKGVTVYRSRSRADQPMAPAGDVTCLEC